jgi:hypothetical protein
MNVPASLSFTATAWEVASEEQVLVPRPTFVSPLLLTLTSPPWAKAAPDTAIIATSSIIIAAISSTCILLFTLPLPSLLRVEGESPTALCASNEGTLVARGDTYVRWLHLLEANFSEPRQETGSERGFVLTLRPRQAK